MKYQIWWRGPQGWEEIDSTDSRADAEYLQGEYRLAYGGQVEIREDIPPTLCDAAAEVAEKYSGEEMDQFEREAGATPNAEGK